MKNIHVLPTDKKTRLFTSDSVLILAGYPATTFKTGKNIFITSDEEIKEGDLVTDGKLMGYYSFDEDGCPIIKSSKDDRVYGFGLAPHSKKIILTTDGDLIKDGVQAPDDEFLEWFVKNPSCEKVKTYYIPNEHRYEIIIPKEEPKQETLEEFIERETKGLIEPNLRAAAKAFLNYGAKWQQDQDKKKYSEEDMIEAAKYGYNFHKTTSFPNQEFEASCIRNTQQWLTTYKKK